MGLWNLLEKALLRPVARCEDGEDAAVVDEETDAPSLLPSNEPRTFAIPSYKTLTGGLDKVMMSSQTSTINDFLFFAGLPISENFLIMNQVSMQVKRAGRDSMTMPEMMMGGQMPFYSFMANYNAFSSQAKKARRAADMDPSYTMIGRVDSQGQVQAMFIKPFWKHSHMRLMGVFPNSDPTYAHYEAEFDVQVGDSKNCLLATLDSLEYSYTQRIGRKLLAGVRLGYSLSKKTFSNGFTFRYAHRPTDIFYLKLGEDQTAASLGTLFRIDENTRIATEIEVSQDGFETTAGLGYERRFKNNQVNTSVRTSGEVKSLFTFSVQGFAKLKLFLGGNLFREDFKCGFSLNLGLGDE